MKPTEITRVQELIYEMKIGEVMTKRVVTVTPDTSIAEFREVLRINRISGTPVVENGRMVGIISLEDLIKALSQGDLGSPVREKMTRNVYTVSARESAIEGVKIFSHKGVGRLPVVDEQGSLVGIITRGDITQGLLKAIEVDYHAEEISRYRASHIFEDIVSDSTSMLLRYEVRPGDFNRGGEASSKIKRALTQLGGDPQTTRRVAIATYEAEMNIIIHTDSGGEIVAEIQPDQVSVRAVDHGPGIADVEQAMQPGFSLAPEWIREMGFGAGVGLNNIQKCADEMNLESTLGAGTRLQFTIYLQPEGEGRKGGQNETS
ncbi:CBS domain-containing protein [Dehalococcoidia bacterium]|nr:CBS domain-containing protein [Dehalococcoidia bacterium]